MKNIEILILLSLLLSPIIASSQDIEGIPLGSVISEEIVNETFGRNYSRKDYIHFPCQKETAYIYGRDSLFIDGRNRLVRAILHSRRFAIDKNCIPGGYLIGDKFREETFSKCGNIQKSPYNNNLIWVDDEEEIWSIQKIILKNNRISSVLLSFPYGDDVEGVGMYELVSKETIEKKFGVPYKVEEEYWYVLAYRYTYSDNGIESYLTFSKEGRLLNYEINSPIFKTFTETIPGGLSVGDDEKKASCLFNDNGMHKFLDSDCDRPYIIISDGKVAKIGIMVLD